jgi:transposase/Skp family chaperone for outer membrane proteins
MGARFVSVDRETPMLLPPDLRDWVPEDDLVHFVIEAVDRLPLESFRVNHRGTGDKQFPPHMMLALLVYSYANGLFSSRKIERATYRDVAIRYLCAGTHPDHDTICKFRRENLEAFRESFVDVLELARELKILKLGNVSLDGTHLKANASIDQNVSYQRAMEIRDQLRLDIDELLAQAESADTEEEDSQKLPEEIARREKLAGKMERAIEELEARARERQQKAEAKYEAKKAERREKEKETGRKCTGREPRLPDKKAEDSKEQCNLSDPDARIMRKNKRAGFTQSYNAQAAVDADGSQLIVGGHVSQSASDYAELVNGVASIPGQLGKPESVLADAGYVNGDAFDRLEQEGVEIYCSVHREDAHNERHYDFRPEKASGRTVKEPTDERLVAMRDKLRSEEGKALYAKRNHTVEPVFGIIKAAMGFRGFSLRGKEKVSGEWTLVCLAYNLRRLHGMTAGAKNDAGRPKSSSMSRNPYPASRVGDWLGRIVRAISKRTPALTAESTPELVLTPTGS